VAAARVILVSDTHLSASAPRAQVNWDAVVSYVGACSPDLVIHLGDLSLDGARDAVDWRHGRTQLDRLPVAWRAVPGNHDIGDNRGRAPLRASSWTPPGISGGWTSSAPSTGR
jgi:3',5'-cyclic AMP phosphodiesterase CpdA